MPKSVKKKLKINRKIVRKLANAISELRADEADAAGEAEMFEEALEHYEKTGQIWREVRESYMFQEGDFDGHG